MKINEFKIGQKVVVTEPALRAEGTITHISIEDNAFMLEGRWWFRLDHKYDIEIIEDVAPEWPVGWGYVFFDGVVDSILWFNGEEFLLCENGRPIYSLKEFLALTDAEFKPLTILKDNQVAVNVNVDAEIISFGGSSIYLHPMLLSDEKFERHFNDMARNFVNKILKSKKS